MQIEKNEVLLNEGEKGMAQAKSELPEVVNKTGAVHSLVREPLPSGVALLSCGVPDLEPVPMVPTTRGPGPAPKSALLLFDDEEPGPGWPEKALLGWVLPDELREEEG